MSKRHRIGFVLPFAVLAVPFATANAAQLSTKQLAGPPSEFAEMQAVEPASTAVHSKSAMLAVTLGKLANGRYGWQTDLPVEGETLDLLSFAGGKARWELGLRDPIGKRAQSVRDMATEHGKASYGLGGQEFPATRYGFKGMQSGNWQLSVESNTAGKGFVLVEGAGATRLLAHQANFEQQVGKRIGFVATVYDIDGAAAAPQIADAKLRVVGPLTTREYPMFDDGLYQDGKAADGVFGADFRADSAGAYTAQVLARGVAADGKAFVRSAEFAVPVIADELNVRTTRVTGKAISDRRIALDLDVTLAKAGSDHYRVYGEVWGMSADGKRSVPVAWIGGMSEIDNGRLPLSLDARWIGKAGAVAPFELRALRIEDPNNFITLAKIASLPIDIVSMPKAAAQRDVVVDEEMRMGVRPVAITQAKGVGTKLLLVHGYCSGNAWGPVAGQFANSAVFQDFNKNRSHDQFANLIKTFGATWNSFGIVAHSQGGAAALHLYNFYWSGLDNATGARLPRRKRFECHRTFPSRPHPPRPTSRKAR